MVHVKGKDGMRCFSFIDTAQIKWTQYSELSFIFGL